MGYFIGIDIGTSGVKTIIIDAQSRLVAQASAEYPLATPQPGWTEQNPEDWWQATVATLQNALHKSGVAAAEVQGIGLSGQMHGSVFLDASHKVIRPALLWNDQRTAAQVEKIDAIVGKQRLLELTANPALTGFTAPKILWLREHEPAAYAWVDKILLPKDYIRFRLTGEFASEVSDASGTLLFDVEHRRWSDRMLELLEIPSEWLPPCVESPEITGTLSRAVAEQVKLRPGIPVVGGGGDQAAGAVGNGIVESGVISAVIGTSGVVFAYADSPAYDPDGRLHTFCHAVPGAWHMMGVTLAAGGSFRWLREAFFKNSNSGKPGAADPYALMTAMAGQVPVGSEGLLFLPYLSGERTPHADPDARGVFFGISLRHTEKHFVRAVMEGVTYSLCDCLDLMRGKGVRIDQVRASGGGARSALWRQMLADTFNVPVVTINMDEGPAFGAALLAGVGTGAFASVPEACASTIGLTSQTDPDPLVHRQYQNGHALYQSLYASLRDDFKRLRDL